MSVEENKAAVRKLNEGINKGDKSVVDEVTSPNFVFHATSAARDIDREAFKNGAMFTAFSDYSETIEDIVAESDRVSVRSTVRGTQKGQLGNIAPSGKRISVPQFTIYRLERGKIAEAWNLTDRVGLYQQLGALPPNDQIGK